MLLRRASSHDLSAIVALERLEESMKFVGQWSEERHRATLAGPDARYYVHEDGSGALSAYAILRGLQETSGAIELKRLVVHPPGQGLGRKILLEIMHIVFEQLHAHRLFLDAFENNDRARHLYRSIGFVEEGVMREAAKRGDTYWSLHLMSMLDREYFARYGTRRQS